jgi:hypothetical protein
MKNIYIPTRGDSIVLGEDWTFTVHADDGFSYMIGQLMGYEDHEWNSQTGTHCFKNAQGDLRETLQHTLTKGTVLVVTKINFQIHNALKNNRVDFKVQVTPRNMDDESEMLLSIRMPYVNEMVAEEIIPKGTKKKNKPTVKSFI